MKHADMSEIVCADSAVLATVAALRRPEPILYVGPPGIKTMIARRIPSLLPELAVFEREEIERAWATTSVPLDWPVRRPFRAPHHSVSIAALCGTDINGRFRAGEAQLATAGVLYLDELHEFNAPTLRRLAVVLEDMACPPIVVASAHPCPCGFLGSRRRVCICARVAPLRSFQKRVTEFRKLLGIECVVELDHMTLTDMRVYGPPLPCDRYRAEIEEAWRD